MKQSLQQNKLIIKIMMIKNQIYYFILIILLIKLFNHFVELKPVYCSLETYKTIEDDIYQLDYVDQNDIQSIVDIDDNLISQHVMMEQLLQMRIAMKEIQYFFDGCIYCNYLFELLY
ncbi:unnamed protein product [Paramecium pentaurelia]|uniref:Transmembrane protein n=1 Tax=Paramecium pentaurelia TaxID=43138 RepID=A0A8S1YKC1_9CILI|nr:unnamed protein product [Paramecium pentaurelia]